MNFPMTSRSLPETSFSFFSLSSCGCHACFLQWSRYSVLVQLDTSKQIFNKEKVKLFVKLLQVMYMFLFFSSFYKNVIGIISLLHLISIFNFLFTSKSQECYKKLYSHNDKMIIMIIVLIIINIINIIIIIIIKSRIKKVILATTKVIISLLLQSIKIP